MYARVYNVYGKRGGVKMYIFLKHAYLTLCLQFILTTLYLGRVFGPLED